MRRGLHSHLPSLLFDEDEDDCAPSGGSPPLVSAAETIRSYATLVAHHAQVGSRTAILRAEQSRCTTAGKKGKVAWFGDGRPISTAAPGLD